MCRAACATATCPYHLNSGIIKMKVHNLYSGSWLSNCYAIINRDCNGEAHAAIVDPSAPADGICEFLDTQGAKLDMIVLTHGHFDHIMSLDELRERTGAPVYIHKDDAELLGDSQKNAYSLFFAEKMVAKEADKILNDGDTISLGDGKLTVIHLPGHTRGSIGLLGDRFILTGDTLFDRGVGRSDLYGGDTMQLYSSIGRLKELDPTLQIYPGHGKGALLGRTLEAVI